MIRSNELRIGSWLKVNDLFVTVSGMSVTSFTCTHKGLIYFNSEDCQPIPLTSEILEKCGFTSGMVEGITRLKDYMDEDEDEEGDTYYWDLSVPRNDKVEGLSTFNLVQFGDAAIHFSSQWLRVNLYYLHQLQNLYFALTGTELEINF